MKLVSFEREGRERLGAVVGAKLDVVLDLPDAGRDAGLDVPFDVISFLQQGERALDAGREILARVDLSAPWCHSLSEVRLLAPVPRPPSMRDAYAFRQHVETSRRNRGLPMIPEFDEFPVFYFTNHQAVFGPGRVPVRARHLGKLDFELECAMVVGKGGKNLAAEKADAHVAGLMIMNDLSARDLQMQEMKLSLGPAKGKDFATVLGPWLVTLDELQDKVLGSPQGDRYDLAMKAEVNGVQVSSDNLSNMSWTFAQILERVSYGVEVFPGDVIGSGTCGTGCFLELNGSGITKDQWLRSGDEVALRIDGLGTLETKIVLEEADRE
jgi:fumarylacetoacetate (FAA) hydrolase